MSNDNSYEQRVNPLTQFLHEAAIAAKKREEEQVKDDREELIDDLSR